MNQSDCERFQAGIELFNRHEFFECHDVLEELWNDTAGGDKQFLQGLIQAAVALFHFEGGNLAGARKMYRSACRYLAPYGEQYLHVNMKRFREDFEGCFRELMEADDRAGYPSHVQLDATRVPTMEFSREAREAS